MKHLLFSVLLCVPFLIQSQDCNQLGVWMWYLEITEFDTHDELADSLAKMGIKRIYVKVADGTVNTNIWPELVDVSVVEAYHNAGLEVWGWSYNYPNNSEAQAEALYIAAQTGYDGFVIDVEMEFDNNPTTTEDLFHAFYNARKQAIAEQIIDEKFKIYCTTWGNPKDHLFAIDKIDPYVDGFMPQTYVEIWGQTYLDNITYWIEEGNKEYAELGATKPIHHIAAMESGVMSSEQVNEFIAASGAETSIWRIPGGGTPLSIWNDWNDIEWSFDFCETSSAEGVFQNAIHIYPNPASSLLYLQASNKNNVVQIIDMQGRMIKQYKTLHLQNQIDVSSLRNGLYTIRIGSPEDWSHHKVMILH
ncbi:MAG: T9SS type A sorting domain-containing protein [Bacteroidota bacterium]